MRSRGRGVGGAAADKGVDAAANAMAPISAGQPCPGTFKRVTSNPCLLSLTCHGTTGGHKKAPTNRVDVWTFSTGFLQSWVAMEAAKRRPIPPASAARGALQLIAAVEALSHAESLAVVIGVVRAMARAISGADGVTFVLRDGDLCHYVEENAIGPLWKGRKFPLTACISGWCMLNGETAAIPDIYVDDRIPHDAYRQTFVKSLIMVPVAGMTRAVAAIGSYWAASREFSDEQVALAEALARAASVALAEIETRAAQAGTRQRLAQLQSDLSIAGRVSEIGEVVAALAHELNQPLTAANAYTTVASRLLERSGLGGGEVQDTILKAGEEFARAASSLRRARKSADRAEARKAPVSVRALAEDAVEIARLDQRSQDVRMTIEIPADTPPVHVDRLQVLQVLLHLLRNALDAVADAPCREIVLSAAPDAAGKMVEMRIADTGPGVAPEVEERFCRPFVTTKDEGLGLGLAVCRGIVEAHGGRLCTGAGPAGGAVFAFTVPAE